MTEPFGLKPLTEAELEIAFNYPAATSRGNFHLIQGNKVIGHMKLVSGSGLPSGGYAHVTVEPDDDATREFFKDDYSVAAFGKVIGLRYDGIIGRPMQCFTDEPEDRHKGTEIVDTLDFDFGIAHPRHASVKGWDSVHTKTRPSVKTKHLKRRPRSSNKIKKIRS